MLCCFILCLFVFMKYISRDMQMKIKSALEFLEDCAFTAECVISALQPVMKCL